MIDRQRLMRTLLQYIDIQSASYHEAMCAEQILRDLHALTYLHPTIEVDAVGPQCGSDTGNIYCRIEGDIDAQPLLFCAHMDTVNHGGEKIVAVVQGDEVKSDTQTILSGDDKSGIVAILEALRVIDEQRLLHRPIEVLFTVCEEVGLLGSKYADMGRFASKCAVVPDSLGHAGNLIVRAPGQNRIYADLYGVAAHAGICPEEGVSAIMVGAEAIGNMPLLRIDEETTANIGTFAAAGATNIVAPQARLEMEVRSCSAHKLTQYTARMVDSLEEAARKHGAKVEIEVEHTYAPFALDEGNPYVQMAAQACRACDVPVAFLSSGGGSDSNNFNQYGIVSFNIGTGMHAPHTTQETLCIPEFEGCARMILHLMRAAQ